jgi:hypothetical protein
MAPVSHASGSRRVSSFTQGGENRAVRAGCTVRGRIRWSVHVGGACESGVGVGRTRVGARWLCTLGRDVVCAGRVQGSGAGVGCTRVVARVSVYVSWGV